MIRKNENQVDTYSVRSTIRMLIPLNKQSDAIDILKCVKAEIQFEPKCISSRIYREVDEVRAIVLEELWESDESMSFHLKSDTYRQILMVIEMAEEPPEIRFDTISCSWGLEIIEKAREML